MERAVVSIQATAHQRRLRAIVQRLVIELGYLEQCVASGTAEGHIQAATVGLDQAIDCLNEHLAQGRDRASAQWAH